MDLKCLGIGIGLVEKDAAGIFLIDADIELMTVRFQRQGVGGLRLNNGEKIGRVLAVDLKTYGDGEVGSGHGGDVEG